MFRRSHRAARLADRLCGPQRLAIFGHRGVGKTTLLTVLYREAVNGHLPGIRLAAADARTAGYLSERIYHLEGGEPLPATAAETELRFHLYHQDARLELVVLDYPGDHVELGKQEPVRDYFRACDAAWFCLDAGALADPAERLRRQQEVEQVMEDYLAVEPERGKHRPAALLLTKSDLLGPDAGDPEKLAHTRCGMALHALHLHCPSRGLFAVSSTGRRDDGGRRQSQAIHAEPSSFAFRPLSFFRPSGLEEPLVWLAKVLQAQDEARMEELWLLAGGNLGVLQRCVNAFARRYPEAVAAAVYQERLSFLRKRARRRRGLVGLAASVGLVAGLWAHDAVGYHQAQRFEAEHAEEPAAALARWQEYQAWHPTRFVLGATSAEAEDEHLLSLEKQARQLERERGLAELRRQAGDPDADPEAVWRRYVDFRKHFPEMLLDGELKELRKALEVRRNDQLGRKAQRAHDELLCTEQKASDLLELLDQADQFLRDFPGSVHESEVRRRLQACLMRLEERDIQPARDYSARHPLNFETRRELYQRYLDRHPGGAFAPEARAALKAIGAEWDRHDFREVRDFFLARPGDIPELTARCRAYLGAHPDGQFADAARDLLRWGEKVTQPAEYRVTARWGDFEHRIARLVSRGPDLSVELEVNGVRYGPSTIVKNRYDPDWDFEYPRPVRWKLGDPVRIRVVDHDWKDRVVLEFNSEDGDPVAMRLLSGETAQGNNRIKFESDFAMPVLPAIE